MTAQDRLAQLELDTIQLEFEGPILRVVLNRPEVLNALSPQLLLELTQVVDTLHESLGNATTGEPDWSVRGIVITGAGARAFAAGADIAAMGKMDPEQIREFAHGADQLFLNLERLPVPVVAAVNGFALGGGFELALACDYIFASENASFALPEVSLGLIPGFGGTVRLAQYASVDVAREMVFTGRRIDAAEALRLGIISRVLPDTGALHAAARESLMLAAQQSPTAIAAAKQTMRTTMFQPTTEAVKHELDTFVAQFQTHDKVEGISAFLEKRRPDFSGS